MPTDQELGQRIAAARIAAGLTLQELADRLGWPLSTLNNYEIGRRALHVTRLYAIAEALGRSPATLLAAGRFEAAVLDRLAGDEATSQAVALFLQARDET